LLFYFLLLLNNNCLLPLITFTVIYSLLPLKSSKKISKWNFIYDILAIYLLVNSSKHIQSFQKLYKNDNILLVKASLSSEEKDLLLDLHRKTREAVGASNMQPLNWSSTLASEAQEYAEECHGLVHSGVMGENLATATYDDVGNLYKAWEKEKESFKRSDSNRQKFPGAVGFGHYTQIVWAANTKVGCGQAYCDNLEKPYNLVCRYEIGNIIDYEVYSFTSTEVETPKIIIKKTTRTSTTTTRTTTRTTYTTYTTRTSSSTSRTTSTSTPTSITNINPTVIPAVDSTNNSSSSNNLANIDNNPSNSNGYDSIENNRSQPSNNNTNDENNLTSEGTPINVDTKDNNDVSVDDGVDVVATDEGIEVNTNNKDIDKKDGNGSIIFVVIGGTAISGAFALFYVKKKKPEQYKKLCHQVSLQQKELGRITKKLTVKVSHSTSTLGRMIERSATATLFNRSKSTSNKSENSRSNDQYNHNEWNQYNHIDDGNDEMYDLTPIKQEASVLYKSKNEFYSLGRNALPVYANGNFISRDILNDANIDYESLPRRNIDNNHYDDYNNDNYDNDDYDDNGDYDNGDYDNGDYDNGDYDNGDYDNGDYDNEEYDDDDGNNNDDNDSDDEPYVEGVTDYSIDFNVYLKEGNTSEAEPLMSNSNNNNMFPSIVIVNNQKSTIPSRYRFNNDY